MCSSCFFTTLVVWQNILGGVISIGVDGSVSFFRTAATTLTHVHDHWAYGVVLGDRTIDKTIQKPVQWHENATRHRHHKHWHRCWCIGCTQNERGLQKKLKVGEWGWVRVRGEGTSVGAQQIIYTSKYALSLHPSDRCALLSASPHSPPTCLVSFEYLKYPYP